MRATLTLRVSIALSMLCALASPVMSAEPDTSADALKPVSAFASITDSSERSVALFKEASKVLQNPRCLNCHPVERRPTQGNDLHPHVPPMQAGASGHGVASLPCNSCHGPANAPTLVSTIQSIPGNPRWSLAPASMAWQGKSQHEICEQLKDTARNGRRSLADIHEHVSTDPLVGWAWHPGAGRKPAPGTQSQFGELIKEWIATGAVCPSS